MEPHELARWTRFAAKGGIGKCTALRDRIAQNNDELMFLQGDEIVVLMQISVIDDLFLGSCEDVIGSFRGSDVRIHGKLKKPMITKRPGSVSASGSPPPTSRTNIFTSSPSLRSTPLRQDSTVSSSSATVESLTAISADLIDASASNSDLNIQILVDDPESDNVNDSEKGQDLEVRSNLDDDEPRTAVPSEMQLLQNRSLTSPFSQEAVTPTAAAPFSQTQRNPRASAASTSSVYTQDDVYEEENLLANRESVMSDGRFGIGLTLLQGMANGDRSSTLWSESGESVNGFQFPTPPNDFPTTESGTRTRSSTISSIGYASTSTDADTADRAVPVRQPSTRSHRSHRSQLSGTSVDGGEWDGDDIYDDYRYSRYSVGSKASRQSKVPSLAQSAKVPPLPDDFPGGEGRPSMDMERVASVKSPMSPSSIATGSTGFDRSESGAAIEPTRPLNIRKGSYNNQTSDSPTCKSPSENNQTISTSPIFDEPRVQSPSAILATQDSLATISRSVSASSIIQVSSNDVPLPPAQPRPQNNNGAPPGPRTPSLFLPHPHAPKQSPSGQVSSRSAAIQAAVDSADPSASDVNTSPKTRSQDPAPGYIPPSMSLLSTLMLAAAKAKIKATTVYGQMQGDFASSYNPVPIVFAIEGEPIPVVPGADARASPQPHKEAGPGPKTGQLRRSTNDGPVPTPKPVQPIPRANFFPKAGTPRPRSRSFSGFAMTDVGIPVQKKSLEEGSTPEDQQALRASLRPASKPGSVSAPSSPKSRSAPLNLAPEPRGRTPRPIHVPSPLSLPAISNPETRGESPPSPGDGASPGLQPPPSPFGTQPPPSPKPRSLRQIASNVMLKVGLQSGNHPGHPVPNPSGIPPPQEQANFNPGGRPQNVRNDSGGPSNSQNNVSRAPPPDHSHHPHRSLSPKSAPPFSSSSSLHQPLQSQPQLQSPATLSSSSSSGAYQPPPPPPIPDSESDHNSSNRVDLATPPLMSTTGATNSTSSSPGLVRSTSLRAKLSLSALRAKSSLGKHNSGERGGGDRERGYDGNGHGATHGATSPITPQSGGSHLPEFVNQEEKVQIQDMEFEIIKPVINAPTQYRASEDGAASIISDDYGTNGDNEALAGGWRSDSPALSPATTHGGRSPGFGPGSVDSFPRGLLAPGPSQNSTASIEAHRLREQKWVSIMGTTPSAQAKKSKKVRKLVLEGVPSSVRGKVWGHILDSKARRMEGLFTQLVKKAPSQFVPLVERDVERCFAHVPHLRDPNSSLAPLILAYTAMVPDIRYRTGLTYIAGHLLLQAPDEDAFWMFVAIMDSHLRGYYQLNSLGRLEGDANIFKNVVQSAEPELANRLFNDYGVRPVDICGPWFSSLFAGILPAEILYRAWDILLYDGPTYLFRVGLSILTFLKRNLMEVPSPEAENVLELLKRLPAAAFPQDPDGFIAHTLNVRVKDDDVRKQRQKLENQLKQQRMVGGPGSSPMISSPITSKAWR